ncbi:Envelope fusion protein [Aphis craccivora]|uniref:Envelope fusion protein n=1 Tax=Aphis craccivora TaxID=307492 RepID=A0A6G0Y2D4_APHCR|nr:Envelope fusion protein [Aphis craccivora]
MQNTSIKEIKIEKFKRKFDTRKLDNVHEIAYSLDEEIPRKSGVEIKTTFIYISYKCNLTTMGTIGRQQLTTNNDTASKERHIVYVKSPKKESKIKEKLLGDTPDRLAINDMPPLLREK